MEIVLVRHGIAETLGPGVVHDADRALTPEGRDRTAAAARGLKTMGYRPDVVLTSPLVRALAKAD